MNARGESLFLFFFEVKKKWISSSCDGDFAKDFRDDEGETVLEGAGSRNFRFPKTTYAASFHHGLSQTPKPSLLKAVLTGTAA